MLTSVWFSFWKGTNTIYTRRRLRRKQKILRFFYRKLFNFEFEPREYQTGTNIVAATTTIIESKIPTNEKRKTRLTSYFNRVTNFFFIIQHVNVDDDEILTLNIWVGVDTHSLSCGQSAKKNRLNFDLLCMSKRHQMKKEEKKTVWSKCLKYLKQILFFYCQKIEEFTTCMKNWIFNQLSIKSWLLLNGLL